MIQYPLKALIILILTSFSILANEKTDLKVVEVSLRMIGHQLLLTAGDSTSRVLPVEFDDDRGVIRFETKFSFHPDDLETLVDSIFIASGLEAEYILEVQDCLTEQIIYSYKKSDSNQPDIVPCKSRDQPESCYNIIVSFIAIKFNEPTTINLKFLTVSLLLIFIFGLAVARLVRNKSGIKKHWLMLGKYYFDYPNSKLILSEQKTTLSSKESELLLLLYNALNTTVNREEILKKVWGDEGAYIGRTLDVFVSKLRKKLDADPRVKIVNVRSVGYKLVVET